MTTLFDETSTVAHVPLRHARLPKWAPLLVGVLALAASALVGLLLGWGVVAIVVVVAVLLYLVALPLWCRVVENRRAAVDRLATSLVWVAHFVALVPLVSLLWTVTSEGPPVLDAKFFAWSMRNIIGETGGSYHAIVGTLLMTAAAAVISVPIGLMCAIYLVEYGGSPSWPPGFGSLWT